MNPGSTFEEVKIDFEDFASKSVDLLCVATTDGYFKWVNESWQAQLGWTRDELLARPFMDFVHPDDVRPTTEELSSLGAGTDTHHFVNRYQDKVGNWHWMEWSARVASSGLIYASCRNIEDQQEPLTETKRQLRLLRLAEEIGGVGHWRVDLERGELYWSAQVYRIHGLDPETFTPTLEKGVERYHPEDRERVSACVSRAVQFQEPFEFKARLLRSDGAVRTVHSAGRVEVDPISDTTRSLIGVFQDVTERDLELQRSNEDLRQFAYAASHDLQAPLRTLMGFGQLLIDTEENLSEEARGYLNRMVKSANRTQALIAELYKYAAVMKDDETFSAVNLGEVIEEVQDALRFEIKDTGATIHWDDLPVVLGRRAQLVSLFLNLVGNAIKFRSDKALVVSISSAAMGSLQGISVADNGIGFENKHQDRIFGLFQRLHQRDAFGGMGVGLALVKRIAENHGGRVRCESTLGQGTTFTVTLPSHSEGAA